MAAVQSQRMPLGTAAAARLRVLDSSRNSQKGAVGLSSCRKRSLEDSENAAPLSGLGCSRAAAAAGSGLSTCSHSKRPRRGLLQLDVSISKRATTSAKRPPAINNTTPSTPSSFSSLQTPAGRSPRRATAKPFVAASYRRIHPPVGLRGVRAPFSIADALHGTFSGSNSGGSSSTVSRGGCFRRMPRSWDFAIHVDGPQEEMTNLMQHSAGLLAIRDDDEDADMRDKFGRRLGLAPAGAGTGVSKKARLVEERGKENIPPAWHSAGSEDADGDSHQQQQQQQPQQGEEGQHQAPTVSVDMPNAPARAVLGELDVERFADRHDVEADRAAAAAEALAAQEERHSEKEKGTQVLKTTETEAAVVEEDIKA